MSLVPPGTPYMPNPQVQVQATDAPPELCPDCGTLSLYGFTGTVLHDEGVVQLPPTTACGNEDCPTAE